MHDDFHSPAWAEHHERVSATIHKAIRTVLIGWERLNAYQFDAPWRRDAARDDRRTQA